MDRHPRAKKRDLPDMDGSLYCRMAHPKMAGKPLKSGRSVGCFHTDFIRISASARAFLRIFRPHFRFANPRPNLAQLPSQLPAPQISENIVRIFYSRQPSAVTHAQHFEGSGRTDSMLEVTHTHLLQAPVKVRQTETLKFASAAARPYKGVLDPTF